MVNGISDAVYRKIIYKNGKGEGTKG